MLSKPRRKGVIKRVSCKTHYVAVLVIFVPFKREKTRCKQRRLSLHREGISEMTWNLRRTKKRKETAKHFSSFPQRSASVVFWGMDFGSSSSSLSPPVSPEHSSPEEHVLYGLSDEEGIEEDICGEEEPSLTEEERKESFDKGAFMDWIRTSTQITALASVPRLKMFCFLVVLGSTMGLLSLFFDILVDGFFTLRFLLLDQENNWVAQYVMFIGWTMGVTVLACAITQIDPNAIGSGIPEMKSLLTGTRLPKYLSGWVFIAKYFGLMVAMGAGLFLGTEGPFVHMSSILAQKMINMRFFRSLMDNPALMHQILSAAVTAGVAASLASPIGGLMFSIEVSSNYWPTRSYTLGVFVASIACGTMIVSRNLYYGEGTYRPLILTEFEYGNFQTWEMGLFALLGIIMGALGSFFVWMNGKVEIWKKQNGHKWYTHTVFFILSVSFCVGLLTFPGLIGGTVDPSAPRTAFQSCLQDVFNGLYDFKLGPGLSLNPYLSLFLWFFTHYLLLPVVLTLPLPNGLTVPLLAIGGSFGRLLGKYVVDHQADLEGGLKRDPGGYALVGGAALLSSVTQTYSPTMIVMEMTGQLEFLFPVLLAVIVSVTVSRSFNMSYFERIVEDKGIPYMPTLLPEQYLMTADDAKESLTTQMMLPLNSYVGEVQACLDATSDMLIWIPVVNNLEERVLLGMIRRTVLESVAFVDSDPPTPRAGRDSEGDLPGLPLSNIMMRIIYADKMDAKCEEREKDILRLSGYRTCGLILEEAVQFSGGMQMTYLHLFFTTQSIPHGYVTKNGKLVGVLRRPHLEKFLHDTRDSVSHFRNSFQSYLGRGDGERQRQRHC